MKAQTIDKKPEGLTLMGWSTASDLTPCILYRESITSLIVDCLDHKYVRVSDIKNSKTTPHKVIDLALRTIRNK